MPLKGSSSDRTGRRDRQLSTKARLGGHREHRLPAGGQDSCHRARRDAAVEAGAAGFECAGHQRKRKDILRLSLADYRRWADSVQGDMCSLPSGGRAKGSSLRAIFHTHSVTPFAATLGELGGYASRRRPIEAPPVVLVRGLRRAYGGAIETRFAKDLPEVLAWVEGEAEAPDTVRMRPSRQASAAATDTQQRRL